MGVLRPTYPIIEHFSWGLRIYDREDCAEMGYPPEEADRATRMAKRLTPLTRAHINRYAEERYGEERYELIRREKVFHAGGYSMQFVQLNKKAQNEIISRYTAE